MADAPRYPRRLTDKQIEALRKGVLKRIAYSMGAAKFNLMVRAIEEELRVTDGVPVHSGNTTSGETPITNVSAGTSVLIERGEI